MHGILEADATVSVSGTMQTRKLPNLDILAAPRIANSLSLQSKQGSTKDRPHHGRNGGDLIGHRVELVLYPKLQLLHARNHRATSRWVSVRHVAPRIGPYSRDPHVTKLSLT